MKFTSITALALLACLHTAASIHADPPDHQRPIVGAIRWDAWTGGPITDQVERTLGPTKHQFRLPWFAEIIGPDKVRIHGGDQAVMDREIEMAADAGLDYWAFLIYAESSSMSDALHQFRKSDQRDRLKFCVILHSTLQVHDRDWPRERDRLVTLMQEPNYQTVLGNRPLVYMFLSDIPQDRFAELQAAANDAGLTPYWVYMGWNPAHDFKRAAPMGFDAVSAYARGDSQPEFRQLVDDVEEKYWQAAAEASVPYVPFVTTGWDKRPRQDNLVTWEKDSSYHSQKVFPSTASGAEIAEHLGRAIQFTNAHPDICPARAIIVYAWNEYDEGGWLAPTRGPDGKPDTERLDAIREVLP